MRVATIRGGRIAAISLGPFVLEARIGRGGMGEVWRARHRQQQVAVALKVLTAAGSSRPMFVESFRNEVRAVASLDHPHIAMVLDYGSVPQEAARTSKGQLVAGTPYLSMELVEGQTLADHMGNLPWREVERVLRGLLDALAHAHARGVIHRDLKLSNVLYEPLRPSATGGNGRDAGGTFKLTDFGIAHAMAATGDPFRWGTPAYMPPEQLLGRWWDYGPWTDLYSLGCCAYALVTGQRPFPDEVAGNTQTRRLPKLVPRMQVPDGFEAWLHALCEPEPAARYQLAADAAYALATLCQGFGATDAVAASANAPVPDDHTTTLAFDAADPEVRRLMGEVSGPTIPGVHRLPPLPAGWKRRRGPRPSTRLVGAGLGLYGLRRIPMIGRSAERDTLWKALKAVKSAGKPRVVVLHGPAGAGKTRLGEWLCERAHELGAASVMHTSHGRPSGPSDGLPGLLARFLRTGGLSAGQIRQRVTAALEGPDAPVARTAGDLAHDLDGIGELVAPGTVGERVFSSPGDRHGVVRRFVEHQARRRPVVMFLDDAHFGLDALEFAQSLVEGAGKTGASPVLILIAARDEELADNALERSVIDEIARNKTSIRLPVGPLPQEQHRALVHELLGLEGALARLVEERTAGNPMFAVQLVGDWVQRGILMPGPRGFELRAGAEVTLPDDLYAAWATRVDDLLRDRPDVDRYALELAAILGQRVDREEWSTACEAIELEPSPDLVDALLSYRLARPDDSGGAGTWVFAHSMLRESLERQAEEAGRARMHHGACAAMVLLLGPSNPERLARHLLGAGDLDPALEPLVDAIEGRCREGEFDRADALLDQWDDAVTRLRLPDGDPRWVRGLRAAATVHRYRDRPEQMLETCARLEAGVRKFGWPRDLLATVRLQQGRLARMAGEFDRAVELFREGLALAVDPQTEATLHARIGQTLVNLGAFAGAEAEYRACLEVARGVTDEVSIGDGWIGLAGIALHQGDLQDATRCAAKARDAYRTARHRWGLAIAWETFGEIARHRQLWDEAVHCYKTSASIWQALGTESAALSSEVNIAIVQVENGNAAKVAGDLDRCAARAVAFGNRSLWVTVRLAQLAAAAQAGDGPAWDRHLAEGARALSTSQYVSPDVALMAEHAGRAALARGWGDRAHEALELALAQWTRLGRVEDADRVQWALD
ncbi:MAG: protein kinase [Myxococcota bacterium]